MHPLSLRGNPNIEIRNKSEIQNLNARNTSFRLEQDGAPRLRVCVIALFHADAEDAIVRSSDSISA
jgi:hypothetical protein